MNATKHAVDCKMSFGRKDPNCPRCQELLAGAAPRARFGGRLTRAQIDAQHAREVGAHRCAASGCGPVCTFGEW